MIFSITPAQEKKATKWIKKHNCHTPGGAIGGKISYSFTMTSIGQIETVECTCGSKLDLTDYSEW